MWILGSAQKETTFLFLPGLCAIAIGILFPGMGETSLLYGLLATALIDSGHVYTTAWRTYFHAEERSSHYFYWLIPIFFFLFFSIWYFTQLPGMWSFIVYSTLYHHIRQVYGFSKWYQSLNKRSDKYSDYFLYGLAIVPIIIYHFRSGVMGGYYSETDLFLFPNENLRNYFLGFYFLIFFAWISYELKLWFRGIREINRVMSVFYPAFIYGYCFLIGQTITQVLFPLLLIHGIAYFGVMGQTLHRTQHHRFSRPMMALLVVLLTATVFGLSESWVEENFVDINSGLSIWITSALVGLSLTPLYCHYAFDALIWKKSHREAGLVFKRP